MGLFSCSEDLSDEALLELQRRAIIRLNTVHFVQCFLVICCFLYVFVKHWRQEKPKLVIQVWILIMLSFACVLIFAAV